MSSKRRSAFELTKDNAGFIESDDDERFPANDIPQKASEETLKTRAIAQPRSRLGAQGSAAPSNAFAGFGRAPAGAAPAAAPAAALGSNPFASFGKPSQPATSFASTTANPPVAAAPSGSLNGSKLKLIALNQKFAETIAKNLQNSPAGDYTKACESYLQYYKQVTGNAAPALAGAAKLSAAQSSSAQSSESEASAMNSQTTLGATSSIPAPKTESTSTITSQGFKFGGNSSGPVTFGGKPVGDKVESKALPGPTFTFKPSESASKPVFDNQAKSEDKVVEESKEEAPKPFSFGQKPAETPKKPFSFGAPKPEETPSAKPAFSFGSAISKKKDEPSAGKPAFSFAPSSTPSNSNAVPFSFGAKPEASASETSEKPAVEKPAFSFAASPSTNGAKPFTFGAKSEAPVAENTEKPAFSFASSTAKDTSSSETKPFSFGNSAPKPFSFGSNSGATPKEEKSGFNFGAPASESKPKPESKSESEGANNSKPFSFGVPKPETSASESKPFTFGSSTEKSFSFGAAASQSAVESPSAGKFSFGQNAEKKFTFGNSESNAPKFSFGGAAPKPAETEAKEADNDAGDNEGAEGAEAQPEEPTKDLAGKGKGEEDEDAVYEKKAKVFKSDAGQLNVIGLGSLRVLVHRETKKARLLLRNESGRVIVNMALKKELDYPVESKSYVRVVDFADGKPQTYMVRVKLPSDAEALAAKIAEVKN